MKPASYQLLYPASYGGPTESDHLEEISSQPANRIMWARLKYLLAEMISSKPIFLLGLAERDPCLMASETPARAHHVSGDSEVGASALTGFLSIHG